MTLEISEVSIVPVKPQDGLVGFAGCVINKQFYLGGIAIHCDLANRGGFRLVWPTRKLKNGGEIPLCHPISKEVGEKIQDVIISEWETLITA